MGNAMSLLTSASVALARDLTDAGQPLAKNPALSTIRVLAPAPGAEQPALGGQAAGRAAEQPAGQPDGGGQVPAGGVLDIPERGAVTTRPSIQRAQSGA